MIEDGKKPVRVRVIFGMIILTFQLASRGVSDETMLVTGLILSVVGYTLVYFCWHVGAAMVEFIFPFFVAVCAFPFLGAPTRSLFTKAVDAQPNLRTQQGTMQAIMSMSASIAGFAAPGLIAAFVLRTPEQVAASKDQREFTAWALFAPLFSLIVLVGFLYLRFCVPKPVIDEEEEEEEEEVVGETSALLPVAGGMLPQGLVIPTKFHPRTQAYRRHSITLMGIPQFSFHHEATKVTRHTIAV